MLKEFCKVLSTTTLYSSIRVQHCEQHLVGSPTALGNDEGPQKLHLSKQHKCIPFSHMGIYMGISNNRTCNREAVIQLLDRELGETFLIPHSLHPVRNNTTFQSYEKNTFFFFFTGLQEGGNLYESTFKTRN